MIEPVCKWAWPCLGWGMLLTSPAHANPDPPSLQAAIWTQPVSSMVAAVSHGNPLLLSLGAHLLRSPVPLVLEGAFTRGNWYGCSTTSTGFWAAMGTSFSTGARPLNGFFLQPKATFRYFSTSGGVSGGFFGCDVQAVQGSDSQISLGIDAGYQFTLGPLYLSLVLGVGSGYCFNCVGHNSIFWGPFPLGPLARTNRLVLELNLNLLRVGGAF